MAQEGQKLRVKDRVGIGPGSVAAGQEVTVESIVDGVVRVEWTERGEVLQDTITETVVGGDGTPKERRTPIMGEGDVPRAWSVPEADIDTYFEEVG